MTVRRRSSFAASCLALALIFGQHATAVAQALLPSEDSLYGAAKRAKIRDSETNTYACEGPCSGSTGCC